MRLIKTAYIEGRPHSHPTHDAYAKSVNSTFHFVDVKLRYHDVPMDNSSDLYFFQIIRVELH